MSFLGVSATSPWGCHDERGGLVSMGKHFC